MTKPEQSASDRIKKFFRRDAWHGDYSGPPPKWHQFKAAIPGTNMHADHSVRALRVEALCGYSFTVEAVFSADGVGYSHFDWRDEVKTKKLRCSKCDAKAATIGAIPPA